MQLFFKPTTAKMLGNLKILVIALLMRSVLRRSFTIFQWEALFLLVAGISVNQLSGCGTGGEVVTLAAAAYTVGSITVPSLASVYNEAALKKHMETSVLLQNFFLYLFGAGFNFLGLVALVLSGRLAPLEAFGGFSAVTVLLVVNNALQGILSSFFFKYADTILKKYSSTIATIFTAVMSAVLFGHTLSPNFCIGVSIVFISMHIFFSLGGTKGGKAPPGQKLAKLTVSPSMDHLALRLPDAASVGSELAARGQEGFAVFQGGDGSVPPPRDKLLPR
ncbi:hypothetical protein H632_c362p2 [Helicosporidium sp. ATCC 50920]|nr:hypothetical protein H632_c362p2 [Helicosporidium sp. ATCC 50920]|eukprot:KDD76087.1 hypothetical protein H632_c362p2 [Helicosporidium sp. ATCC 50920]